MNQLRSEHQLKTKSGLRTLRQNECKSSSSSAPLVVTHFYFECDIWDVASVLGMIIGSGCHCDKFWCVLLRQNDLLHCALTNLWQIHIALLPWYQHVWLMRFVCLDEERSCDVNCKEVWGAWEPYSGLRQTLCTNWNNTDETKVSWHCNNLIELYHIHTVQYAKDRTYGTSIVCTFSGCWYCWGVTTVKWPF